MPAERIQKVLAAAGAASRRGAEELIAAGRVRVNGKVAMLGEKADPAIDRVELDGRPIGAPEASVHFAVHKPPEMLSSSRNERGRRSVIDLIPMPQHRGRLWPAGRLDAESEGLMILTNDGEWANRVLHPRYGVEREYAVLLADLPTQEEIDQLLEGVELDDGPGRLLSAERVDPPREVARGHGERGTWVRVRVGEGRKREVRRLFAAIGQRVQRLVRTQIGSLAINGLRMGDWRVLRAEEVALLAGAGAPASPAARRGTHLTIAIDGPSGSGKSTVGYAVAQRVGATFVDTGLMYRALTLAALDDDLDLADGAALGDLARRAQIAVRKPSAAQVGRRETVLLNRRDVTELVRTPRVDRAVSTVSAHPEVRDAMLAVQRAAAKRGSTVMVGRDIATVVVPDATLKVFLTASAQVRAARRAGEMGDPERTARYLEEIERRDAADSGRAVAPLRRAADALVIDTGELDVEACVDAIVAALPARRGRPA
jgi:23S rRNA pseudouridine2605 synthase